jgi:hypothetical protein
MILIHYADVAGYLCVLTDLGTSLTSKIYGFVMMVTVTILEGVHDSIVVKALCYKLEGLRCET